MCSLGSEPPRTGKPDTAAGAGNIQAAQREHARALLSEDAQWWRVALSEARDRSLVSSIETVFFRIDIESMSGLRAVPEAE